MPVPTITFSLVASSRKPLEATTGSLRSAISCGVTTPSTPPKWSAWAWVNTTAVMGLLPRCWRAKASAAAEVSRAVSGSTTIQPVLPSISVMLAMSKPRNWYTPSVTLNRPVLALSSAWRHRLGFTVSGALPSRNL